MITRSAVFLFRDFGFNLSLTIVLGYGTIIQKGEIMLSVNQFRANLKQYVDQTIDNHEPLEVNRKNGEAFIVMSLEDYKREQETLYVLSNNSLMSQIQNSLKTHVKSTGYTPSTEELGFK